MDVWTAVFFTKYGCYGHADDGMWRYEAERKSGHKSNTFLFKNNGISLKFTQICVGILAAFCTAVFVIDFFINDFLPFTTRVSRRAGVKGKCFSLVSDDRRSHIYWLDHEFYTKFGLINQCGIQKTVVTVVGCPCGAHRVASTNI